MGECDARSRGSRRNRRRWNGLDPVHGRHRGDRWGDHGGWPRRRRGADHHRCRRRPRDAWVRRRPHALRRTGDVGRTAQSLVLARCHVGGHGQLRRRVRSRHARPARVADRPHGGRRGHPGGRTFRRDHLGLGVVPRIPRRVGATGPCRRRRDAGAPWGRARLCDGRAWGPQRAGDAGRHRGDGPHRRRGDRRRGARVLDVEDPGPPGDRRRAGARHVRRGGRAVRHRSRHGRGRVRAGTGRRARRGPRRAGQGGRLDASAGRGDGPTGHVRAHPEQQRSDGMARTAGAVVAHAGRTSSGPRPHGLGAARHVDQAPVPVHEDLAVVRPRPDAVARAGRTSRARCGAARRVARRRHLGVRSSRREGVHVARACLRAG